VSVCPVVGQQQMREMKWGISTHPQKLATTVHLQCLSILPTLGWYYRPRVGTTDKCQETRQVRAYRYYRPQVKTTEDLAKTHQRTHIGTTDPRSVLPTKAENMRKDKQMCTCWLGVPHTH
jgi:hypothetical protein